MLRSAAAADVQAITDALIAVINSLPSGGECVQHYRAVQRVQSAARACVDKYTLQNSEGDPVAYQGVVSQRNRCLRANIRCRCVRQTLGRILEQLMQRGYARDALRRSRSDRRGRESGEAGSLFGHLVRDFRADASEQSETRPSLSAEPA